MTGLLLALLALLGLAVGSFLNVVVWRLPRGESLSRPASACPGCGSPIRARDNVPVLSWLVLHGRCRDCGQRISARYPLVELGTAVLFVLVGLRFGVDGPAAWAVPAYLYLAAIAVALALIDLDTHRLPNRLVLPSYIVGAVLLAVASAGLENWDAMVRAGIGAVGLWVLYFLLLLAHPGGMGYGDVKLAGVLGMYLAWLGWGAFAVGAFAAFLLGGLFSIALVVTRRAGRKTGIPFGPWMLAGGAVGVAAGEQVWSRYLELLLI